MGYKFFNILFLLTYYIIAPITEFLLTFEYIDYLRADQCQVETKLLSNHASCLNNQPQQSSTCKKKLQLRFQGKYCAFEHLNILQNKIIHKGCFCQNGPSNFATTFWSWHTGYLLYKSCMLIFCTLIKSAILNKVKLQLYFKAEISTTPIPPSCSSIL